MLLQRSEGGALGIGGGPGGNRGVPENVVKEGEAFLKRIDEVYPVFANIPQAGGALGSAGPPLVFQRPPALNRLLQIMGAIEQFTAAPTKWQLDNIKLLIGQINEAMPKARKLLTEDLPAFNKMMNDAGVPHINVPLPGQGRPGQQRPPDDEQ